MQFLQKMTVSKHVDGQPSALLTREENQANNVKISHSNWWWHILSSLLKSSKQFSFRMYWPYWLDWKSVISSLSLLLPGGAGTSGEQMSNSCHHSCAGFQYSNIINIIDKDVLGRWSGTLCHMMVGRVYMWAMRVAWVPFSSYILGGQSWLRIPEWILCNCCDLAADVDL